jgi:hypothetical protein
MARSAANKMDLTLLISTCLNTGQPNRDRLASHRRQSLATGNAASESGLNRDRLT